MLNGNKVKVSVRDEIKEFKGRVVGVLIGSDIF